MKNLLKLFLSWLMGEMRDALSILEQCLAYDRHLTVENINKVYGLLANDEKIRLIKLLLTKDMKNVLKNIRSYDVFKY